MELLLNQHDVAKYFGVTDRTLRTWIQIGELPSPIVLGRKQYWLQTELQAWLLQRAGNTRATPPSWRTSTRRGRPRLPA
jgi:excisionase family DNA binding protein